MIEIENVTYRIGKTSILSDVSITIEKGGITALIGPNGAGKSTLLSLMARLIDLQSGQIRFDGLSVCDTPGEVLARKLAILRQETMIGSRLTLRDLVAFGRYPHHKGQASDADRIAVEQALQHFGLEAIANRFTDEVSGGQRQRAMVAMAFCQDTDYLLLDEPLNNLDMPFARSLMQRLREMADNHNRTIIIVLHEINYAAAYADRIIALKEGRVIASGPPEQIVETSVLKDIYGIEIAVEQVKNHLVALHHI